MRVPAPVLKRHAKCIETEEMVSEDAIPAMIPCLMDTMVIYQERALEQQHTIYYRVAIGSDRIYQKANSHELGDIVCLTLRDGRQWCIPVPDLRAVPDPHDYLRLLRKELSPIFGYMVQLFPGVHTSSFARLFDPVPDPKLYTCVYIEYKAEDDSDSDNANLAEESGFKQGLSISIFSNVESLCLSHRKDSMGLYDGFESNHAKYKRDLFANAHDCLQFRLATYVDVLIRPIRKANSGSAVLPQMEVARHGRDDRSVFSQMRYVNDHSDVIHEKWSVTGTIYMRCSIAASAFDQATRRAIANLTSNFVENIDPGDDEYRVRFANTQLQQAVLRIVSARFGRTVFSSRNARVAVAPIGFHFCEDNGSRSLSQRGPSVTYSCWFYVHRYLLDTLLVLMSLRLNTNVLYEIVSWLPTVCLYKRSQLVPLIVGVNNSTVSVIDQRSGTAKRTSKRR
jgi:hypothetical protein